MQAASLDRLFRPRSIAVIGASRRKGSIGWQILHNLVLFEFQGMLFPVNPGAQVIHSIKCYPSVSAIEDEIDLAILIVPSKAVLAVAEECGRKGVAGLVVISAGFNEIGGEGVRRERELLEVVHRYGMRMVGPNCMGILNTAADVRMDAVFAETLPLPGNVAFLSQSGAIGAALIAQAAGLGLGFSQFASIGNKADISGNDLIEYWGEDAGTDLILMYLESFGNPRNFTRLARRVTREKPMLVVKAGRTALGARAASSHTGALAGADVAVDALLGQCGVQRVNSVEELFDVARAFASQPIPAGRRVGIVTNAGGPAILAADALVALGLELPETGPEARAELARILPEEATLTNPVDLIGSATTEHYQGAISALARAGTYDALIVICVPTVMHDPTDVYLAAADAAEQAGLPCLGVFMGADDVRERARQRTGRERFPAYHFPESAVGALGMMVEYSERRARVPGELIEFEVDRSGARALIDEVRAAGRTELDLEESRRLLCAFGVPFARSGVALDAAAAIELAGTIDGPVVLKAIGRGLSHKSELGGVLVGLAGEPAVRRGFRELEQRMARVPGAQLEGVLVQEFVADAREVIVGMSHDPAFGPLLMFGLGGIYVEVLKDVAFRVLPFTDRDAREMVRSVKALPILEGVRGQAPVCFERIEEVLLRVAQLVQEFPEIAELDLNPLMASPDPARCLAVDARVRLSDGSERHARNWSQGSEPGAARGAPARASGQAS